MTTVVQSLNFLLLNVFRTVTVTWEASARTRSVLTDVDLTRTAFMIKPVSTVNV